VSCATAAISLGSAGRRRSPDSPQHSKSSPTNDNRAHIPDQEQRLTVRYRRRTRNALPPPTTSTEMDADPEQLRLGPYAVMHAIADHVVDSYFRPLGDHDGHA
jgi:hypothetical protein